MFSKKSYKTKYKEEDLQFKLIESLDSCKLIVQYGKTKDHIITFKGHDKVGVVKRFNSWGKRNIQRFKDYSI